MLATGVTLPAWVVGLLAMLPPVTAAVTAVAVGIAQHRHEREKWMRDTRLASYVSFADASETLGLRSWDAICSSTNEKFDSVNQSTIDVHRSLSKVVFVRPDSVTRAARAVDKGLLGNQRGVTVASRSQLGLPA